MKLKYIFILAIVGIGVGVYFYSGSFTEKRPKILKNEFRQLASNKKFGFQQEWVFNPKNEQYMAWKKDLSIQSDRAKQTLKALKRYKMSDNRKCKLLGNLSSARITLENINSTRAEELNASTRRLMKKIDNYFLKQAKFIFDNCEGTTSNAWVVRFYSEELSTTLKKKMLNKAIQKLDQRFQKFSQQTNIPVKTLRNSELENLLKDGQIDQFQHHHLEKLRNIYPELTEMESSS